MRVVLTMDIVKTPQEKPWYVKHWYIPAATMFVIVFFLLANKFKDVSTIVYEEELLTDTVVAGELLLEIRAYGKLVPKYLYRIGAEADGQVDQILVRAGDKVNKGDCLVRLSNPQLLQQLKDAELEYAAQQAEMKSFRIELETQLLDLQAEVTNAEIDYQNASMELDANEKLMAQGYAILSKIEQERARLNVQKYQQRWEVQQQRAIKYEERLHAKIEAQQARLAQSKNRLEKTQYQVEKLHIRAAADGIVQDMPLDVGESIRQGQAITQIARPDALVAEVNIPELQVQDIKTGMLTTIDTRSTVIEGRVTRIDPKVVDGGVLVEVDLLGKLPAEVRPDLNVEANIEVARIASTHYVRRPVFAKALSTTQIFKIDSSGNIADKVAVEFGRASTNYIEVKNGLEEGDKIIISDPSQFESHKRLYIN